MTHPVLELEAFGVAYGDRVVLREVTTTVAAQGCTVLLGPSGTGKSTLLRTLAGSNSALAELRTWGRAVYAGQSCLAGERGESHRPALVMQNSRLLVANVLENLVCMLPGRAGLTRGGQVDALRPLLAACGQDGLLELLARQVVELPPWLQRVVAVLREAAAQPQLLMLDEPTAGLPAADAQRVLEVVDAVSRRTPLLVVLHNLQEAQRLARDVILLSAGRVQEAQAAARFFAQPASESGRLFLATGSCPEPGFESRRQEDEEQPHAARPVTAPTPLAHAHDRHAARAAPSAARGPRGFVWLLPGRLAGTPLPGIVHGPAYDLQALRAVGVTHLVSLTEQPFDPALAQPFGISCLASPMPDMHPPTLAQALELCACIDRLLAGGHVVAVHCHAGLGRTGTVLAAYWIWSSGGTLSAPRALEDVRRLEPGWVQSEAQVRFLEEFAPVVANTPGAARGSHDPEAARDVAAPSFASRLSSLNELKEFQ